MGIGWGLSFGSAISRCSKTIARKQLIDLSHTPYYHCINRCVRRAWLCGDDPLTGKNYDGRKQSIVNRMKFLTTVFGIELCAYVVMSNHYHVVLHDNAELIDNLTEKEVAKRWVQVYKNAIGIRYIEGAKLDIKEQEAMNTYLPIWRERLKDISWYMRALNEGIARKVNKSGNRDVIPAHLKPILIRPSINPAHWVSTVSTYKYAFGNVVGSITQLDDWRKTRNQNDDTNTQWLKGDKVARNFYN